MFEVNNKNTRTMSMMFVKIVNVRAHFKPLASVSIVDFGQVNFS